MPPISCCENPPGEVLKSPTLIQWCFFGCPQISESPWFHDQYLKTSCEYVTLCHQPAAKMEDTDSNDYINIPSLTHLPSCPRGPRPWCQWVLSICWFLISPPGEVSLHHFPSPSQLLAVSLCPDSPSSLSCGSRHADHLSGCHWLPFCAIEQAVEFAGCFIRVFGHWVVAVLALVCLVSGWSVGMAATSEALVSNKQKAFGLHHEVIPWPQELGRDLKIPLGMSLPWSKRWSLPVSSTYLEPCGKGDLFLCNDVF
jgi:hypothetical protein